MPVPPGSQRYQLRVFVSPAQSNFQFQMVSRSLLNYYYHQVCVCVCLFRKTCTDPNYIHHIILHGYGMVASTAVVVRYMEICSMPFGLHVNVVNIASLSGLTYKLGGP